MTEIWMTDMGSWWVDFQPCPEGFGIIGLESLVLTAKELDRQGPLPILSVAPSRRGGLILDGYVLHNKIDSREENRGDRASKCTDSIAVSRFGLVTSIEVPFRRLGLSY